MKVIFSSPYNIILFILFVLTLNTNIITSFSNNPEIVENDLGTVATACASKFCSSKDSLDLWLDIEWDCHGDDDFQSTSGVTDTVSSIVQAPSRKYKRTRRQRQRRLASTSSSSGDYSSLGGEIIYSRTISGLVCAVCGAIGMIIGISLGRKWDTVVIATAVDVSATGGGGGIGGEGGGKGMMSFTDTVDGGKFRTIFGPSSHKYTPVSSSDDELEPLADAGIRGVAVTVTDEMYSPSRSRNHSGGSSFH